MSSHVDLGQHPDDSPFGSHSPVPPVPPPGASFARTKSAIASRPFSASEHLWAIQWPDVQKACFLARICAVRPPTACRLHDIPAIQQEGPTCGLVAASMLGLGAPDAGTLLAEAQRHAYTRHGEMFDAGQLLQLAADCVRIGPDNERRLTMHTGPLTAGPALRTVLENGGCLLVPYDADFNHGPCMRNGHRAHWALICGYLIDDEDKFYVFARHGKAKNIAVWPFEMVSLSNSNLWEFEQPRNHPNAEFRLPTGGIAGPNGLRERCVVIESDRGFGVEYIVIR